MISVIQRVNFAKVFIDNKLHAAIGRGLLVFTGIIKGDDNIGIAYHAKKILELRIFEDDKKKMNLNVKDVSGELLAISQFTLCTDKLKSGNRPSFYYAEEPALANRKFNLFISELSENYKNEFVKSGIFAADMKVELLNDGPVTIILEK